jgi:hypothetical protein
MLSGLIGMSFDVNALNDDYNSWRMNEHLIVLYNNEDTDTIITEMFDFFIREPMPHTSSNLKGNHSEEACLSATLERFHECHDKATINMDAIIDFKKELR